MTYKSTKRKYIRLFIQLICMSLLSACSTFSTFTPESSEPMKKYSSGEYEYKIGPGDQLNIFVWRNPEVSSQGIPVRPDGKISAPLIDSMVASGKTPTELADEIEEKLAEYIKEPFVTVAVVNIVGGYNQQVRVVGEAANPSALPYNKDMTLLDVMIAVGGLTEFAAGNKASIVRSFQGEQDHFTVRLEDLIKGGDISANVEVLPGDIVIIPESLF